MKELVGYLIENAIDAIFPYKCSCGKWGEPLCDACFAAINDTESEFCPFCKRLSEFGRVCSSCRHRSSLTGVMVVGPHQGILKSSIWRLKYGPLKAMAEPLAEIIIDKYGEFLREKRFVITYVPSSRYRTNLRGYNQARELARTISERTGLELVDTMARPKDILHQVGLTRRERLENVVGTISYVGSKDFNSRKIVVVDDVYTTGATLEECAKVLRAAGYREVWGLVLSRD